MRAFTIYGPREARVVDVEPPMPGAGQVVVDVSRVGLCGTDVELFSGTMPYLLSGAQKTPMIPGHEWVGTVSRLGVGVSPNWHGQRVTGDTMIGCDHCDRCRADRHHVCEARREIGIRGNWPGALAEQLLVPASALRALPDSIDDDAGAMAEPGGCAYRAVRAAQPQAGQHACVFGPGTLGLLSMQLLLARGVAVDVVGVDPAGLALAARLGATNTWCWPDLPCQRYDMVLDTSTSPDVVQQALRHVEPTGRVVLVGIAGSPSLADLRDVVLGDVTITGIMSASGGLDAIITEYASGKIDTSSLVAAVAGLDQVADVLAGGRPAGASPGPKILIDPRRPA